MSNFLQMDIFFIIASTAVLVVGGFIIFLLYRIWLILKLVEGLIKRAEKEGSRLLSFLSIFNSSKKRGKQATDKV